MTAAIINQKETQKIIRQGI